MFASSLSVMLRSLLRRRLSTGINVLGLSLGMAACILIMLYAVHETSYDRFWRGSDHIHRVAVTVTRPGQPAKTLAYSMPPAAAALRESFPGQIEAATRLLQQRSVIAIDQSRFLEQVSVVDPNFFAVFQPDLLAGDANTAFADPSSLVVTQSMARKLFGSDQVLGRRLTIDGAHEVRVTAILRDLPAATHFDLRLMIPIGSKASRFTPEALQRWTALFAYTYVRLSPGTHADEINRRLPIWEETHFPSDASRSSAELAATYGLHLRPVVSGFQEPLAGDPRPAASPTILRAFLGIAALTIGLATINFVNLGLAGAMERSREVALRKILGATRFQILIQFIAEATLVAAIALLAALVLVEALLPFYGALVGSPLPSPMQADHRIAVLLGGLILFCGLAGGIYPGWVISAGKLARVLTASASGIGGGQGRLGTALITFQFAASTALIAGTFVVHMQIDYSQTKDLGFDKDNVVVIEGLGRSSIAPRRDAFLKQLETEPGIFSVAAGYMAPGFGDNSRMKASLAGQEIGADMLMRDLPVSHDYLETLGADILAGRNFDEDRGTDTLRKLPPGTGTLPGAETIGEGAAILNQAALDHFGIRSPDAALGRTLEALDGGGTLLRLSVIGVVRDFHLGSTHDEIPPAFFYVDPSRLDFGIAKLRGGSIKDGLASIEALWKASFPELPLQLRFLDERIDALYDRDRRAGILLACFSVAAVLIACMGLLGLAASIAAKRTGEIAVRKILGASTRQILQLLLWQFTKPVFWSNLLAWPLAFLALRNWLENYAYRIDPGILPFIGATAITMLIAWITVAGHAYRVAALRPVQALRHE